MRVLFLEVDTERTWSLLSIGPGFLSAFLRQHGHSARLLRAKPDDAIDTVAAGVEAARPDLLGLSLTSRQWLRARELVEGLRSRLDIPVVAGGLHPTTCPEAVLDAPGFDYLCLGEGEEALLDLVNAIETGGPTDGIDNIWKRGGDRPRMRAPLESLDALPPLSRDLLDEPNGVIHMVTQRGCPFPCTYCAAGSHDRLYRGVGRYGRRRSVANVIAELRGLVDEGRLSYAVFLDDTFTLRHDWVREFCDVHAKEIKVPFSLHARADTVDRELLARLAAAGCNQIAYGVESGSERVRREVMRRPMSNRTIRDVFRWTREAGIGVTANYMLGLPGETREDLDRTLAMAAELDVLDFGYFVFYPYPGTELFEVCRERGYLPVDYLERPANHRDSILTLPDLTREEIARGYEAFTTLRRELYARRHASLPPGSERDAALEHVDENARLG